MKLSASPTASKSRPTGRRRRNAHIFEKDPLGWHVEPTWIIERLLDVERFDSPILDPACGMGRIPDAAKAAGYRVRTGDIADRGYPGCKIENFLDRKSTPASVICNPWFDRAEEFARHAFKIGAVKVAFVFPTAQLHAAHWLRALPLRRIWLLTPRPSMPPGDYILAGGKVGGGWTDYCWLIFEAGYVGAPELRWLHRDPNHLPNNSEFSRSAIGRAKKRPVTLQSGAGPVLIDRRKKGKSKCCKC